MPPLGRAGADASSVGAHAQTAMGVQKDASLCRGFRGAEPLTTITMKLSQKDKEFLERLHELIQQRELWIERVMRNPSRFVLRGNYGDRIEERFGMTRQGVRWRFFRLFNQIYVSAYTTVLFIEKHLGTGYRQDALRIAHERFVARQRVLDDITFKEANTYRGKNQD